ncbi:hypothetical protein BDK51DRAFT_36922 [Blyttiomyces helicus]|uniref:Uncharacterized protein n=1 Tax=Blyttiomyces helicus TaxID=388810 RepID=A0A4P9WSM0_9FUNG|nr:hypothetical protein BDK51DRAFT_36922 [Blyttiomyces helicus]|eukprot:RKO94016.1 hypothetical protein BDK51DRAFT_36922 [Blyttiomyces helicus]
MGREREFSSLPLTTHGTQERVEDGRGQAYGENSQAESSRARMIAQFSGSVEAAVAAGLRGHPSTPFPPGAPHVLPSLPPLTPSTPSTAELSPQHGCEAIEVRAPHHLQRAAIPNPGKSHCPAARHVLSLCSRKPSVFPRAWCCSAWPSLARLRRAPDFSTIVLTLLNLGPSHLTSPAPAPAPAPPTAPALAPSQDHIDDLVKDRVQREVERHQQMRLAHEKRSADQVRREAEDLIRRQKIVPKPVIDHSAVAAQDAVMKCYQFSIPSILFYRLLLRNRHCI